jgi:hypothetical protein
LGGHHVPAFEVRPGEAVTLRLPAWFELEAALVDSLTGKARRPEVDLAGRCVFAEPAYPPVGWRRWFSDSKPTDWLRRRGLTRAEAAAVLARHGIDDRFPLSRHAANPRTLLGLAAAYHRRPDLIVFHTHGLDPAGVVEVQGLVRSHLDATGAIYLSAPVPSRGTETDPVFHGSTVVEIVARPAVPV